MTVQFFTYFMTIAAVAVVLMMWCIKFSEDIKTVVKLFVYSVLLILLAMTAFFFLGKFLFQFA